MDKMGMNQPLAKDKLVLLCVPTHLDITTGEMSPFYAVTAFDPDVSADLHYTIVSEKIQAFDEDGAELDPIDFEDQFGVVENTGEVYASNILDREVAASFIVVVEVKDTNAEDGDDQVDESKYPQSYLCDVFKQNKSITTYYRFSIILYCIF